MKQLTLDLPVRHDATLMVEVTETCIPGMFSLRLTNTVGHDIETIPVDRDYARMKHTVNDTIVIGIVGNKPSVAVVHVDRNTRVEIAATVRDGVATALCKVYIRSSLYINAMYRGDGKHRVVMDKFKAMAPKEESTWRKPNSRLSSALSATSK